jgi:hypothetical protein
MVAIVNVPTKYILELKSFPNIYKYLYFNFFFLCFYYVIASIECGPTSYEFIRFYRITGTESIKDSSKFYCSRLQSSLLEGMKIKPIINMETNAICI